MKKKSFWILAAILCSVLVTAGTAWAAQYDIKQITPEVKTALESRQARYDQLQQLKSEGKIGEDSRGYTAVLAGDAGAQGVSTAENANRKTIYEAIAEQNNLGPTGLSIVEGVFAEVHHEKSRPGDSVQQSSGEWIKK